MVFDGMAAGLWENLPPESGLHWSGLQRAVRCDSRDKVLCLVEEARWKETGEDLVRLLVEMNPHGWNVLHLAVKHAGGEVVVRILEMAKEVMPCGLLLRWLKARTGQRSLSVGADDPEMMEPETIRGREVIREWKEPGRQVEEGWNALHLALKAMEADWAVEMLIDSAKEVMSAEGFCAWLLAETNGTSSQSASTTTARSMKWTALLLATFYASSGLIKYIVARAEEVMDRDAINRFLMAVDNDGYREDRVHSVHTRRCNDVLHYAIQYQDGETVRMLLKLAVKFLRIQYQEWWFLAWTEQSSGRLNSLHLVARNQDSETAIMLLDQVEVIAGRRQMLSSRLTPRRGYVYRGLYPQDYQSWLYGKAKGPKAWNSLHYFAAHQDARALEALLTRAGARMAHEHLIEWLLGRSGAMLPVRMEEGHGWTSLHFAARWQDSAGVVLLVNFAERVLPRLKFTMWLLQTTDDDRAWTVLHLLCTYQKADALHFVLTRAAQVLSHSQFTTWLHASSEEDDPLTCLQISIARQDQDSISILQTIAGDTLVHETSQHWIHPSRRRAD